MYKSASKHASMLCMLRPHSPVIGSIPSNCGCLVRAVGKPLHAYDAQAESVSSSDRQGQCFHLCVVVEGLCKCIWLASGACWSGCAAAGRRVCLWSFSTAPASAVCAARPAASRGLSSSCSTGACNVLVTTHGAGKQRTLHFGASFALSKLGMPQGCAMTCEYACILLRSRACAPCVPEFYFSQ